MADPEPVRAPASAANQATIRSPLPADSQASSRLGSASRPTYDVAGATIHAAGDAPAATFHLPAAGLALGHEIGRGGIGVVREGVQLVFGRTVAVKTLRRDKADPEMLASFYSEAVATASLQHPHIVPIIDLTETGGEIRLLMKRVEGVTWHALLHPRTDDERRLAAGYGLDEHLEILLKVIEAVAYAHARGVLHRDLKPTNVMVGDFGEVQVMDWGCAVTWGDHSIPGIRPATRIRNITGTPAYLAPEMARPEPARIGPASDVYLLGGILYEILTGHRPHGGDSVPHILFLACEGVVVPPAQRAPERTIPRELAALAMHCLEPDISRRPSGAQEVAERLRRYFRHRDALRRSEQGDRLADEAGDDLQAWGRVIALADQALEDWPECPQARDLRLDAGLDCADAAFRLGSFALAATQAQAVARLAEAWQEPRIAEQALEIGAQAEIEERRAAARIRQVARMRRLLRLAMAAVAVIAVVLGTISTVAWLRMRRAEAEHAATLAKAAPAWLARAAALADRGELADAAVFTELAVRFNPGSAEAHLLAAELALLKGDLAAGMQALQAARDRGRPGLDSVLNALAQLPDAPPSGPQRDALAQEFANAGLDRAANGFFSDRARRLTMYQERLARNLGLPVETVASSVSLDQKGGLTVVLDRIQIQDLRCLDGLPVADLTLSKQRTIKDLKGLRGLPLTRLALRRTEIRDLAPLVGLPIGELALMDMDVSSLAPLQGLPLTGLTLVGTRLDLSPIAKLPRLEKLSISDGLLDLAWLPGKPLKHLVLKRTTITNVPILARLPLTELTFTEVMAPADASYAGISFTRYSSTNPESGELARLAGARIQRLDLTRVGCSLAPLKDLRPRILTLAGSTGPIPGAELAAIAPGQLILKRSGTETGLAALRGLKQGTIDGLNLPDFFALGDALAAITGQPIEALRFRSQEPERAYTGIELFITLAGMPVSDLRPLGCLGKERLSRTVLDLQGCRFGGRLPALPEHPCRNIDISFSDVADPAWFFPAVGFELGFLGIPLADASRLRAAPNLEGTNLGIPLVANRTTLAECFRARARTLNLQSAEFLPAQVDRVVDLLLYEVMRLEFHVGKPEALARLSEYQRLLKDPDSQKLAERLRTTIEGRVLRK